MGLGLSLLEIVGGPNGIHRLIKVGLGKELGIGVRIYVCMKCQGEGDDIKYSLSARGSPGEGGVL